MQAWNANRESVTEDCLLAIPVTFAQFLSASKRDLMIDIQKLNNTTKIDILGRFVMSVSDEGKNCPARDLENDNEFSKQVTGTF